MITITNLAMQYGSKLLFTEVDLALNKGLRYGLVGANGAGKSTFFKVLTKDEDPSDGEVNIPKYAIIGSLKQDHFLYENELVINTVIAGKDELWQALQEKERILSLETLDDASGYRLGELEQIIFDNDGYIADIFAAELLVGLGIPEESHYKPLSVLSGGYKLRVLLAQSLFNNPDILLLDEPTNHLDIISINWLENYLKQKFRGVLVFISHDKMFLNNVATHILDIDYGEIRQYTGNYDIFITSKQALVEQKLSERVSIEKKMAHMQAFVERFRALASKAKQAQSRIKQLDKIELPDLLKSSRVSPAFNFKQKKNSGKLVLTIEAISKHYGDAKVLNNVNFSVARGEKLVIMGPNGVGKSTLLKIITSKIAPDIGKFEWGYESGYSYFAQDHHDLLNENISVLDWLQDKAQTETVNAIRTSLGQMLFRQDEVNKNILNLSGGEGARLLFARIMLEQSNVLILDEPTNHLDLEAKETLRKALQEYPGTLILVTHDRDFAKNLATRIIALSHKKMIDFRGTYTEYLEKYSQDYLDSKWVLNNSKSR